MNPHETTLYGEPWMPYLKFVRNEEDSELVNIRTHTAYKGKRYLSAYLIIFFLILNETPRKRAKKLQNQSDKRDRIKEVIYFIRKKNYVGISRFYSIFMQKKNIYIRRTLIQ